MSAHAKIVRPSDIAPVGANWLRRLVGPFVWLHVACNEGNNGTFEGKAMKVQLECKLDDGPDLTLDFDCLFWGAYPAISYGNGWVRICGVKLAARQHAMHVGNWCWDAWQVEREAAAKLLIHARFKKWFRPDSGDCALWEAWESADRPNASDQ